jgi:hypothetical protein
VAVGSNTLELMFKIGAGYQNRPASHPMLSKS